MNTVAPTSLRNTPRRVSLDDMPVYDLISISSKAGDIAKGGVSVPFPWRLHECLETVEKEGLTNIISWQPHGRAFKVHKPKQFVELIMPRFFGQTKYPSFQRQLNIYGFSRFLHNQDKGAYYHLCFVRGHPDLVRGMVRRKIKGNRGSNNAKDSMEEERKYDFYNPVWKNHFKPTLPTESIKKASSSPFTSHVSVVPVSPVTPTPVYSGAAAFAGNYPTLPLFGGSGDATNENIASLMPEEDMILGYPEGPIAPISFNREDNVVLVSDEELSSVLLPSDNTDDHVDFCRNDLAHFEGNSFHMVDEVVADCPPPVAVCAPTATCDCCNCTGDVFQLPFDDFTPLPF